MKCAIVQFEAVHEEIVPSIISAFTANGAVCEAFINQQCLNQRGDIFASVGTQGATINYVPIERRADWQSLAERVHGGGFDAICFATFQRDSIANWSLKFGVPVFGVVHNVEVFRKSDAAMQVLQSGGLKVLTLAPHVASFACRHFPNALIDSIGVMEPVQWGEPPERNTALPKDRLIRLAVPGGVKFATRDYLPLLDAVAELAGRAGGAGIQIDVIGGGSDREELEERASSAGLSRYIHFAPLMPTQRVGYHDYIAHLRAADFLLPLNPPHFPPYHTHKITSAVPTSIGLCLPAVLDRWTHFTYRTPGIVADMSPLAALERVLSCSDEEYAALGASLRQIRTETLARNSSEIGRLLARP